MKEAKHEAEQAIAAYRAEMEASYQSSLARVMRYIVLVLSGVEFICEFFLFSKLASTDLLEVLWKLKPPEIFHQ